jgi:uncharacterized protein
MTICGIADIHGDISLIDRAFDAIGRVDLVLLMGDISHFGHAEDAKLVIEAIREKSQRILAVAGNCDYHDVEDYLDREEVSVHRKGIAIDGIGFIGAGSSLPCLGKTPNESCENDFRRYLQDGISALPPGVPSVFVTHEPPLNTSIDLVGANSHVGSSAIRDFIEKEQPLVCFCGHIHDAPGIDTIGNSKIVNPGPLRKGKFVFAEIVGTSLTKLELRSM